MKSLLLNKLNLLGRPEFFKEQEASKGNNPNNNTKVSMMMKRLRGLQLWVILP